MVTRQTDPSERVVEVGLEGRSYPIVIGARVLGTLGPRLRERIARARAVAVITDENVGPLYGEAALTSLRGAEFEPVLLTVPAGDATKSLESVSRLYDALAEARIDRASPVVALGGGVVGDLTGFVAATWLRGVPFIQCPTTIEADVDASVGGKTGVNHASGKNMIGAFYQPRFVLIDTSTLRTLSERDFRAGLAESIKHAVVRDADFFDWHERNAATVLECDTNALGELIERNVRIKAEIVALDEREVSGMRALLNFGHTVGHAIESAMARRGDPWRHGECVAVGMVAAAEMSVVAGRLDATSARRIQASIDRLGLPVTAPLASAREEINGLMRSDKKVAAGKLRFVLADRIGQATLYDDIREEWIAAGLDAVLV
jgi:3-dehydroquinate synthase